MSYQMYCPKCDLHLGGVWPTEEADWDEVIKSTERAFAKMACEDKTNCHYEQD